MSLKLYTIPDEYNSVLNLEFPTSLYYHYDYVESYNNDIVIRWGNSYLLSDKNGKLCDFKNVLNSSNSINFNCHKHKALEKLSSVVHTPNLYKTSVPNNILVVVRPFEHSSGNNFEVKKGPFNVPSGYYATHFIPSKTEFRVWYINGKTIYAKRVTKSQKRKREQYPCRSLWPYKFYKKVPIKLHQQTCLAFNTLNLEFGAADILCYKHNYYFLELNSAPTIDHKRLITFYKTNLIKLAAQRFPHINLSS